MFEVAVNMLLLYNDHVAKALFFFLKLAF